MVGILPTCGCQRRQNQQPGPGGRGHGHRGKQLWVVADAQHRLGEVGPLVVEDELALAVVLHIQWQCSQKLLCLVLLACFILCYLPIYQHVQRLPTLAQN